MNLAAPVACLIHDTLNRAANFDQKNLNYGNFFKSRENGLCINTKI